MAPFRIRPATAWTAIILSTLQPAYGSNEAVLYSFKGGADGSYPEATLLPANGVLYGTTSAGGTYGLGTVFKITTGGTETVIHSFGGGADGSDPVSSLVNLDGILYGTTVSGGKYGYGTVYSVNASGSVTILHSFGGSSDGQTPESDLTVVGSLIYGTTEYGGYFSGGVVYRIDARGKEKVVHAFGNPSETDGINPLGGVVKIAHNFYGTTFGGGTYGAGTVYAFDPNGGELVLHSFNVNNDGISNPISSLVELKGELYGATNIGGVSGCGGVFESSFSGQVKIPFIPGGSNYLCAPVGAFAAAKGRLYGLTKYGGDGSGNNCATSSSVRCGAAYYLTTDGGENALHTFGQGSDGSYPKAGLTYYDNKLYGTTSAGGKYGYGAVFRLGTKIGFTPDR